MPIDGFDIPTMTFEDSLFCVRGPIPNANGRIIAGASKLCIGRTERQTMNWLSVVRIKRLNRSNGWSPVLDIPASISRKQIVSIVTPTHGSKAHIVRGHNQFKRKGNPIPQGELSFSVAR
jgi:hypothetical protein